VIKLATMLKDSPNIVPGPLRSNMIPARNGVWKNLAEGEDFYPFPLILYPPPAWFTRRFCGGRFGVKVLTFPFTNLSRNFTRDWGGSFVRRFSWQAVSGNLLIIRF
jgi:hypothetical protein